MGFDLIYDSVYMLKGRSSCNVYLLNFDKKVLVDTGHYLAKEDLLDNLKKIPLDINEIDYIFCTHSHGDHVGGVRYLKELNPDLKIVASSRFNEYQSIRKSIKVLDGAEDEFPEYNPDISSKNNDEIDLGDEKVIIYETIGHTRDSISFYLKNKKLLFSGDVIYNGIITQLDYYQNLSLSLEELLQTYNNISTIDTNAFLPGHGPIITEPLKVIEQCKKKISRLKSNPEMLIINTFIPSAEYYIHKNPGLKRREIIDFFVKNMAKFKDDPMVKTITENNFIVMMEKLLSLMSLLNMIKEEDGKMFLKNDLNSNL